MLSRHWPFRPLIRQPKAESAFLLGAAIFLYWNFVVAHLLTSENHGDGGKMMASSPLYPSNPIYLMKDPTEEGDAFGVSSWSRLSEQWDSRSTYRDLLLNATHPVKERLSLSIESARLDSSRRIIYILYTHPKMASTTLRRACWENLRETCDVVSPKRDPIGYSSAEDLASLIRKCHNTHHFCVMGWHFNRINFPNITISGLSAPQNQQQQQQLTFVHMFPFRNFRDWAISGMKQVYVGHSDAGCATLARRLETCDDGWLELDFKKYSKRAISEMLGIASGGGNSELQRRNLHHLLLYDFVQTQRTLQSLSHLYQVQSMPYLNMKHKETRQDGSCPYETLHTFHECFDNKLLEL